jgi:hypothetical protein
MSWRPEVIADPDGKWCCNGLRFATEQEAVANARAFAYRWTCVTQLRAVESPDPVTHVYVNGKTKPITEENIHEAIRRV